MPGQGVQFLPLSRIPDKWDPVWFAAWIREVLALADTRNAIEGPGITITGQPGEAATISSSEDIQNLLLQTYVLATPSGFLEFERVLAGEANVVEIVDGGANGNITVRIRTNGLTLGKLRQLSAAGILGNPVDGIGNVVNIQPAVAQAVMHFDGTSIEFDIVDHSYVSDFDEAAQDAVGAALLDSTSINFTYDDGAGTITATIIDAYVQALVFPLFAAVTLITQANETANFPASRRLVAGANVSFNIGTPGQLIISSSGGGGGGGGGYPLALGHMGW